MRLLLFLSAIWMSASVSFAQQEPEATTSNQPAMTNSSDSNVEATPNDPSTVRQPTNSDRPDADPNMKVDTD